MQSERAMAVVLFATFAGLVFLAVGVVGRQARGMPRCRSCNADVRAAAWDSAPRCPGCNADLSRGGSVRLKGGRQRRRDLVAAAVCAVLALGVAGVDWWLASRGLTWRELRPASLDLRAARSGKANEAWVATNSLKRRLRANQLSPADQNAWLAQLLAQRAASVVLTGAGGGPVDGPIFDLARSPDASPSWNALVASGPFVLSVNWQLPPRTSGNEAALIATAVSSPTPAIPAWTIPRDISFNGARIGLRMSSWQNRTPWACTSTSAVAQVRDPRLLPAGEYAYVMRVWVVIAPVRSYPEANALFGDALRELEESGTAGEVDLSDRFGMPVRIVPIEASLRFRIDSADPGVLLPPAPQATTNHERGG